MHDLSSWHIQKSVCLGCAVAAAFLSTGCAESRPQPSQSSGVDDSPAAEYVESVARLPEADKLILAEQEFGQARFDETINHCTSILRHHWESNFDRNAVRVLKSEARYLRGRAFLAKQFPQIAIEDFDEAIRFGDDELKSKAFLVRAKADSQLQRWTQTVTDSTESIRLLPDNGDAFLIRGKALEKLGYTDRANRSLAEAERLGVITALKPPIEPELSPLKQARLHFDAGSPAVARKILEKQLLNGNENAETLTLYAQCLFVMDEFYASLETSTRAIAINPSDATAFRIRGLSNFQRGSFDQAIKDLLSAVARDITLTETLIPWLEKARQQGGMDPSIRAAFLKNIRNSIAQQKFVIDEPGSREQWLLELIRMIKSPDQIEHFESLMKQNPEGGGEAIGWLAEYLLLDRQTPAVKDIRDYLKRVAPEGSDTVKQLWQTIESRSSAIQNGATVYSDIGAYAIQNDFLVLLQRAVDAEIFRLKFDHLYQSIQSDDPSGLKIMLPQVSLLENEPARLLRDCIEQDRKIHAMLIISQFEQSLNWKTAEFLELGQ